MEDNEIMMGTLGSHEMDMKKLEAELMKNHRINPNL